MTKLTKPLLILGFSSLVNAQDSLEIPVNAQEIQGAPEVTILVKQGCNLTGWQSDRNDSYTFFVSCGNNKQAIAIHDLGKLDNVIILTEKQEIPVIAKRNGTYGVNWDKVNQKFNEAQTKAIF